MRGKEATTAGNGKGKGMKSGDEQHLMSYDMSLWSEVNLRPWGYVIGNGRGRGRGRGMGMGMGKGKEATTAGNENGNENGEGKRMKSGDEQHLQRQQMPYGMSLGSEVNMTNCVKHWHHFFHRRSSPYINQDAVIAYWMMAGYLGPATEFDQARRKGMNILGIGYSSMVSSSIANDVECNHEGFCVLHNLGFFNLLDSHYSFNPDVIRGFDKYLHSNARFDGDVQHSNIRILMLTGMTYLVDYEATPDSLKKMLAYDPHPNNAIEAALEANNLNALLIRGCEFLSSPTTTTGTHGGNGILSQYSTSDHFNSLTVVEISSSSCSPIDIGIISELTRLQGVNLSHLPDLEMLPDNLFRKLTHLRWLIVRGCCKLRSLPSIDGLTRLEVLELSHCTSLQLPFFLVDIRYPHLQILDLSYTPVVYRFRELSTPNLTHLFLRGSSRLNNLLILNKLDNLQVLDLAGCGNLLNLSSFMNVPSLNHLNLSGCTSFTNFHEGLFDQMSYLEDLDLSWTKVKHLPSLICLTRLRKLSLRGLQPDSLVTLASLPSQLLELDLTGFKVTSSEEFEFLKSLEKLEILNLSGSSLEKLPDLCKLISLKKLLLANCPQLEVMPDLQHLGNLVELDLTGLKIRSVEGFNLDFLQSLKILNLSKSYVEKLPDVSKLVTLEKLLLADCQHLKVLPNLSKSLKILNLSKSSVEKLPDMSKLVSLEKLLLVDCQHLKVLPNLSKSLKILNLSKSSVEKLPNMYGLTFLKKLFLADCEQLKVVPDLNANRWLKELDLSGLQICSMEDFNLDFLQSLHKLEILNLSRSSVEKLPGMSNLESLEKLLLADCPQLKVVPYLRQLHNLKTLDLSLPNDSSIKSHQLEFGPQIHLFGIVLFPLPASLRRLVLTNRSGIQKLFPNKELVNLEFLDLHGTDVADCDSILGALKAKAAEIHVVYGAKSYQPSKGDDYVAVQSDALISYIQEKLKSSMTTIHTDDQAVKMQLEMLDRDLMYIQGNIEGLKNSNHWKSTGKELLQELEDAEAVLSTPAHWAVDSAAFKQLRRVVVKLKLLVSPKDQNDSEALQITKKKTKKKPFIDNKESIGIAEVGKDMQGRVTGLLTCYKSLSQVQKQCLLCFSIFPLGEDDNNNNTLYGIKKGFLIINKKVLIYWWVGEGFINVPHHQSTESETTARRDEVNEQVSATEGEGVNKLKSIEEIGKQILNVLVDKDFIEPVIRKGRESASYWMHPFVHSFVIERAKEEGFFDFDQETCKLIPHFSRSRRACLLTPQDKFPSSCEFWAGFVNSPKRLANFENVKTLFNVNDSMVDIKREWFSKMKNMCVLHLGNWRSENADLVEVVDQKFLEDLNRLKKLRLLSLQGLPTIMKLPDSVCQLSNLIILDLKECSYLEELPADIGSLKSLTHLDISNCPLVHKLPKGISLLSKLQVLRGFVFTEEHGARASEDRKNASILSRWFLSRSRNDDVCTLRDLLKLKLLRELSVVVNIRMFPSDEEVQLFKEMKQLRKLKILWEKSLSTKHSTVNRATEQETLTECSGWNINLKCWGHQPRPSQCDGEDTEESKHLDNIEKLELWCFPHEETPEWLNPTELRNLDKLCIVGGQLTKLRGLAPDDDDENPWNVKTLRLKHLHKLDIQWDALKKMFPRLRYLEKHKCDQLVTFPCDWEGVWKSEN